MKEDLTHYLSINTPYFLVGLAIYFLITLFKVHILCHIQPRLFELERL